LAEAQKLEGACHHIYVTQFSEPPLLVALFARRRLPLIVARGRPKGGYLRKDDGSSLASPDAAGMRALAPTSPGNNVRSAFK
jgi:hypothetical protein